MADKITNSTTLKLLAGFVDEDDRTIRLSNPRSNLTAADINALNELATPVLIGDKYGATFSRFKTALIEQRQRTELDLTT